MSTVEMIAAIKTLSSLLIARADDREMARLARQIEQYGHDLESAHGREMADLESRLREENVQLATELKSLLPQAARERNEARAKATELEAKNQALETRIKALETKAVAPRHEMKPVNIRQAISSQDFEV